MVNDKHLINEVALRLNDESFRSFPKHHYQRVLDRVKRQISRKYKLDKRIYVFKNTIREGEIPIELPNYISPVSLKVNQQEYTLVNNVDYHSSDYEYKLFRDYNKLHFEYNHRSDEDTIELIYTADITIKDDYYEDITPVIPEQYNEEIINHFVVEMCKLGISKYIGEEGRKYGTLIQLYARNLKEYDQNLIKKEGWSVIKPQWIV